MPGSVARSSVDEQGSGTYQSGQGEAVTKASHGRLEVARLEVLVDVLALHGGVHVRPDEGDRAARDAAPLVGDLDGDVFLALDDDDLDRREAVFVLRPEALDDRAERVFEQLEADVREVTGDVGKVQLFRADELHGRALEHGIVLLAHEAGEPYEL